MFALDELGMLAANVLARAIARGVYEATALPFAGALPSWQDKFGNSFRSTEKPLRPIGRRIDERRSPAIISRDQMPGRRARASAPNARGRWQATGRQARRAADDGRESGKHGRLPSQVLSSARSPSGNNSRACGMTRSNCTGVGGASRGGEFDAGGHADALLHRRDHIAGLGIEHRPRQRGIALRRKCR